MMQANNNGTPIFLTAAGKGSVIERPVWRRAGASREAGNTSIVSSPT
jgi:hypothetical protein